MGDVVSLPAPRRPPPNLVRVGLDFGQWTLRFYRDGVVRSAQTFDDEASARTEARRLWTVCGLRQGPDFETPTTTHDGGGDAA